MHGGLYLVAPAEHLQPSSGSGVRHSPIIKAHTQDAHPTCTLQRRWLFPVCAALDQLRSRQTRSAHREWPAQALAELGRAASAGAAVPGDAGFVRDVLARRLADEDLDVVAAALGCAALAQVRRQAGAERLHSLGACGRGANASS